ncbi:MAG TPA: hypothetical protein VGN57_10440 [Pirellulaceae bacterium]|jgi:hypothetical protein|nr:hypothetical protein [Pirellulaceae bacterium]
MNPLAVFWIGALALCQAGEPAEDPRRQISTTVPAMVTLLEKQEYRQLIEDYVDPSDLEEALQRRMEADSVAGATPEESREAALGTLVKHFGGRQAKELLAALQAASANPPAEAGPDQDRLTLLGDGVERPLVFVRIDGLWRLKN